MFFLSDDTRFTVETEEWARPADPVPSPRAFWQVSSHTSLPRMSLVVLAGSQVVLDPIGVEEGDVGFFTIGAALPRISDDGLVVSLKFRPAGTNGMEDIGLVRRAIDSCDLSRPWEEIEFDLGKFAGKTGSFVVGCEPGPAGDPCADWAGLYELVIGAPDKRLLLRARGFRNWRAKNENEHFSAVQVPDYTASRPEGPFGWLRARLGANPGLSPPSGQRYAGELLQRNLGQPFPDFVGLLRKKIRERRNGQPLRILALCCGIAQKEGILMSQVDGTRVHLTLMDLNGDLLQRASDRLTRYCETRIVPCDLNYIDLQGESFDVILCAAGLHHIIELERVGAAVAHGLARGGEFWSISEYIGRPGARLWPEAYVLANPFFQALPEKYRVNGHSGKTENELPDVDCSVATFEGIRAPEIEGVLGTWLRPLQISRQACWIWRLLDSAYGGNYDPKTPEDRKLIQRAVVLDADYQRRGGKPTGLNATYTLR
jgi:hypothetical protein